MAKVSLGRIRTVFKGEWAPAAYEVDDVVLYAGSSYTCIAIAGAGDLPTDTAFWVQSAGGLEFTGTWDTAVSYKGNQIVTFNGSTYIALTVHSGTQPTATGQTDWSVMAESFKFEGAWDISTVYQTNDIVTFSGSTYIALVDHTGIEPVLGGNSSWALFAGGFQFEGAWDVASTYQINDVVTLSGSSYIALISQTGTQPEAAGNAAWVLFAAGGDIADQTGQAGKVLKTDGTGTSWGEGTFIDWNILTANTTAVPGTAYIINTSSSAFSLTLPSSPSDNDYILINDGMGMFSTNSLTVVASGNTIAGLQEDLVCDVDYSSFRLTFKTTIGWILT